MPLYRDRTEAGRKLGEELHNRGIDSDSVVLALPRGGVPVAYEVAEILGAPLDVFVIRKLGVPGHEELAMGAIASGGTRVLNEEVTRGLHIPGQVIDAIAAQEQRELEARQRAYRDDEPPPDVRGRTVVLVDDGLATGSTMRAAIAALRARGPARIVVAVPIASPATCSELSYEADEVVCAETREPFYAVGFWYQDFSQTTDQEVRDLLRQASSDWNQSEREERSA